ncbi:MAG: hypothetical protein IPK15_20930 [Verrucomicrobia bacterium]|nr:hypothetical protein [Verrucomicrobiota bacterium]
MFLELRQWTTSGFPVPTGVVTRPFRVPGAGTRSREDSSQRQDMSPEDKAGSPPSKSSRHDLQEKTPNR